ncbi:MAG: radical SAM family heme chaperone HemW [Candidatus Riflebacteria bacterium]|nr:radical SAM family heme chaperone HemW [Candidatus Riflebacteria bacterium]
MSLPIGLYVHIPFCRSKCHYCDFASAPGTRAEAEWYLDLLAREASRESPGRVAETVFVGGGTPTCLSEAQLERLFREVLDRFPRSAGAEVTIEANPESLEEPKARLLARLGANRISLGVQSFDDAELAALGRIHRSAEVRRAVAAARAAGFDNLNLDLLCGFPGNDSGRLARSLEAALELSPDHLSVYLYQHEDGSVWGRSEMAAPEPDLQADLYFQVKDRLESAGFEHYEISNFARPGRRCRHNLKYWTGQAYVGLGTAASSFDGAVRRTHPASLTGYATALDGGPVELDALSPSARAREALWLRLRLLDGVGALPADLPAEETAELRRSLERHVSGGLLRRVGAGYALTRNGLILSNEVFADLI